MNTLTNKAIILNSMEKGTMAWDLLFSEVFEGVQASSDAIVNSYAYSLRGDIAAGHSLAMEHILTAVEKFQYSGYEFLTFYKKTLNNRMVDLVRTITAQKAKHNTSYAVSLSYDNADSEGTSYSVEDRLVDSSLLTTDEYSFDSDVLSIGGLLESFGKAKPEAAAIIQITMMYSAANGFKKQDLVTELLRYFGEDTYTNRLQQQVSRATKSFKNYAAKTGYVFNF